jgi:hypothetical protein
VQDEAGDALADATVTLCRDGEVIRTTRTNAAGRFALWRLRRGTYTLTVETQADGPLYSETRVLTVSAALQNLSFVRNTYRTS